MHGVVLGGLFQKSISFFCWFLYSVTFKYYFNANIIMICEICKEREATDIHHIDGNHKNNDSKNIQYLCTICHSNLHGISPKQSELKRLIILRDRAIKIRNAMENQIRGFSRIEFIVPDFWVNYKKELNKKIKNFENEIKKMVENNGHPIIEWLLSIKGIGFITAAKLISYIDIKKTPTISALWRYCGLDATHTKRRRKVSEEEAKKFGHPYLKKELLGVLADNFIKKRTPVYREVYDKEKEKQLKLGITKLHAHRRAIRKMMKIFLSHLWIKWRTVEGLPVSKPYVIERLGHQHFIEPIPL